MTIRKGEMTTQLLWREGNHCKWRVDLRNSPTGATVILEDNQSAICMDIPPASEKECWRNPLLSDCMWTLDSAMHFMIMYVML